MQDVKPVRLQRSRRKGDRLVSPNGLPIVCVTRPSRWGNPWIVGMYHAPTGKAITCGMAADLFRAMVMRDDRGYFRRCVRRELKGKNLACWCPLGQPCHADVLLEIANEGSL